MLRWVTRRPRDQLLYMQGLLYTLGRTTRARDIPGELPRHLPKGGVIWVAKWRHLQIIHPHNFQMKMLVPFAGEMTVAPRNMLTSQKLNR